MAARDLGPWTYTDDKGRAYVRRGDKFLTGQQVGSPLATIVGGSDGSSVTPYEPMPRNLRPRGLYCAAATGGYKAFVVIYDQSVYTAALASPITIDVRDAGGTTHSVTSYDGRQEKRGRTIRPGS